MRQPLVFIVDDEEQICTLLTRTLARDGLATRAFASADAALEAVGTDRPDLIVTDMMMPGLTGLELAQRARAVLPNVSVVVITGYASLENVVEALRNGIDDFVTKPFGASEFRAVVARVLERRARHGEPRTAELAAAAVADRPPENAALARRLRDMALLEAVHGVLADELESRDVLRRCRAALEGALGVSKAVILHPTRADTFRITALTDGTRPPSEPLGDLAFLSMTMASGNATACGLGELGALSMRLDNGPAAAAATNPRHPSSEDAGVLVVSRPAFGRRFEGDDLRVVGVVASALGDVWRAVRARERAEDAYVETLCDLVRASEVRSVWFRDHSDRVHAASMALAFRLGVAPSEMEILDPTSRLLDLARAGLPDELLTKTDRLTPEEWRALRAHPEAAAALVRPVGVLRSAGPVLAHHHENWDGSGYPGRLRGDEIPNLAAIVRITDTYTALTSPRPWRQALEPVAAVRHIVGFSGTHFHPQYVAAFTELHFESEAQ